jgi:hypothetical protein
MGRSFSLAANGEDYVRGPSVPHSCGSLSLCYLEDSTKEGAYRESSLSLCMFIDKATHAGLAILNPSHASRFRTAVCMRVGQSRRKYSWCSCYCYSRGCRAYPCLGSLGCGHTFLPSSLCQLIIKPIHIIPPTLPNQPLLPLPPH